jgi:hypothetical protein
MDTGRRFFIFNEEIMKKEILVNVEFNAKMVAIVEDGHIEE